MKKFLNHHIKATFLIICVLTATAISSCSTTKHSGSENDSKTRTPQSISEFFNEVPRFAQLAQDPKYFSEDNCSALPDEFSQFIYEKPTQYFLPQNDNELRVITDRLDQSIRSLFDFQIILREKYQRFEDPYESCRRSLQRALRVARVTIDYLIDWGFENNVFPAGKLETFGNSFPHTLLVNPDKAFEFQTGDVIMQRGETFVSATIARIGNESTNFSHIAIVGEDANTGKKFVVEAEPATGVLPIPLEDWVHKPLQARAVLFRYKDQDVSTKAGRVIYEWISRQLKKKKSYRYDFKMVPYEYSEMFCSEVAQAAYDWASGGQIRVPEFPTSFSNFQGHKFIDQMGVKVGGTFAPGDMELDRRFTMIAEWRYVAKVSDKDSPYNNMSHLTQIRLQDASMTSIFNWMKEKNYELRFDLGAWLETRLAKGLRRLGAGADMIQAHVPGRFVTTIIRTMALTEDIEGALIKFDQKSRKETKFAPSFIDLMKAAEEYRVEDCKNYLKYSSHGTDERGRPTSNPNRFPDFHNGFNVKSSCPL